MKNMVNKMTWDEFRDTGLLLFINQILHVFGWSIVVEIDGNGVTRNAFPARVKFRGFDDLSVSDSYVKISKYLGKNIKDLIKESKE